LHTIVVVLLFLVLRQMTGGPPPAQRGLRPGGSSPRDESVSRKVSGPDRTGAIWCSAFVAAVFAIHPLRVESVAWISERKDVLSAVFFMLTLGAYVRYARFPSLRRYVAMSILFALGLMSKPMLVTVPFLLLLLDYWPLERFSGRLSAKRLILEKIPLLTLSAAAGVATLWAQQSSVVSAHRLPLLPRIGNGLVSCVTYLKQMVWPVRLAAFYPHPEG